MKATVVVDNIKSADIPGEWGLCIYIEYAGRKILQRSWDYRWRMWTWLCFHMHITTMPTV